MNKNSHVDGVEHIAFAGNAVRISFFALQAAPAGEGDGAAREESASLVLSPEAFLRTRAAFNQMFDELISKGVFKENAKPTQDEDLAVKETTESDAEPPAVADHKLN
ncbi:hypothetical protein RKLH11_4075 [Rhodobacteraceae bacterium KLH11]|nr:hypothetical protein RKLH11_4075 [Rhodobacteraceae bacterium KLH11]